jgi:Protein kinase domain/Septum formation
MSLFTPLQPGDPTNLGRIKLLGRLGEGGMGVVFLGQDEFGYVAVKTIRPALADDENAMRRFRREVDAAKRVPRYCTAQVYGDDFKHRPPYIVTEFIKGPTLGKEIAANGPMTAARLHGLAFGMASALSGIHAANVVHGDLTPGNVLLSPLGPRVIDFGIARVPEQTMGLHSQLVGTPAYMAPEHFSGRAATEAADVFAWGSVVCFAGTGRPPFGRGTLAELTNAILNHPPRLDGLDPTIRRLVEAALQRNPKDRPTATWLQEQLQQTAAAAYADQSRTVEVETVLENAQRGSPRPVPAMRQASPPPPVPPARGVVRHPVSGGFPRLSTAVVLLVAALVLALASWTGALSFVGKGIGGLTSWLLGFGAAALPLLLAGCAIGVLVQPREVPLWPRTWEATWEAKVDWTAEAWLHAAWTATRGLARLAARGPVILLLGGLGLLHVLRDAPSVHASFSELARSGGLLGAVLTLHFRAGWWTPILVALLLAWGLGATVLATYRRSGSWPAAVAFALCLAVLAPAIYLNGRGLESWVETDGDDRLIVLTGNATDGVEPRETAPTGVSIGRIPPDLHEALHRGVRAESPHDAAELVSRLADPRLYDSMAGARAFADGEPPTPVGTCLNRAPFGDGWVRTDCADLHDAELYAVLTSPFRVFPAANGGNALADFGKAACQKQFTAFVGISDSSSTLNAVEDVPTRDEWADGTQEVACLLEGPTGSRLQGSMRGTRRIFADSISPTGAWSEHGDEQRCAVHAPRGGLLPVTKDAKPGDRTGVRCVAVPALDRLASDLVTNATVTAKAAFGAGTRDTDRIGLVCRQEGNSEYNLTIRRDRTWLIQKKVVGKPPADLPVVRGGDTLAPRWQELRTLQAACTDTRDGVGVRLQFRANGKLLGEALDQGDPLVSGTVGVIIVADDPDAFTGTFDNLTVDARGF